MEITLIIKDNCEVCPAFHEVDYGEYACRLMTEYKTWFGSKYKGSFPIPDDCPLIELCDPIYHQDHWEGEINIGINKGSENTESRCSCSPQ